MATSHGEVLLAMLQKRLPEGVSRNKKQSSGLFSRRTPEHACEGRETGGCNIGRSLIAGWALLCWFWALCGANTPDDVLLEMLQKRLPGGGDGH